MASPVDDSTLGRVKGALVALGFKPAEADAAVAAIAGDAQPDEPFETLMKRALAQTS